MTEQNWQDELEQDMQQKGLGSWQEALASDDNAVLGAKLADLMNLLEPDPGTPLKDLPWNVFAGELRARVRMMPS